MRAWTVLLAVFVVSLLGSVAGQLTRSEVQESLKATPDDPTLHYRKCQALFREGKEQAAVDHAEVALAKFKAAGNNLAWMMLGSIKTERHRIDVHFNMGPRERAEPRDGIVRPLSFRVWTLDEPPTLVRTLDFELAYTDGAVMTAAIGEMSQGKHSNFGIIDAKSDFATIKKRVLELVEK